MSRQAEDMEQMVAAARDAMAHAYAPYSRFAVGAAVLLSNGDIVTGANFENASYGLSLCAEAVALASANASGRLREIQAIALVGKALDAPTDGLVTPCGRCRQILNEAQQLAGRQITVYCAAPEGSAVTVHTVSELLPFAFGSNNLGLNPETKR
ncbi:cytidine deaminase [Sphingobium mellinum]|uniref:cytidine deaminase n=1 Tax=Sphingobium mellinum TaxID=1387166 RepID=UPI0030EC000B